LGNSVWQSNENYSQDGINDGHRRPPASCSTLKLKLYFSAIVGYLEAFKCSYLILFSYSFIYFSLAFASFAFTASYASFSLIWDFKY
jgi:hypothetical protein